MAVIMKRHFSGGGNQLDSLYGGGGKATMQKILEDIAADLLSLKAAKAATIVAADAADLATAITLVNEIKTKLNAVAAATLLTSVQA